MKTKAHVKSENRLRDIYDLVEIFALCAAVMILICTFAARIAKVEGSSMEETLHENEYLLVSDLFYTPDTGDIVVIHNPALQGTYGDPLVKRVIAVGGQTVDIDYSDVDSEFIVKVNGETLEEPYVKLEKDNFIYSTTSFTVPEGKVFVMGDNRNHSGDSRSQHVGFIDERSIVGHALIRVFPPSKISTLW